jgi:hypothetical protein
VDSELESHAEYEATTKKLESKMEQIIKELTE